MVSSTDPKGLLSCSTSEFVRVQFSRDATDTVIIIMIIMIDCFTRRSPIERTFRPGVLRKPLSPSESDIDIEGLNPLSPCRT